MGDFNFYCSLEDRNRPGGDILETFRFNDAIGHLGMTGIPIKGRAYTWSNMGPLLEQLDWFFTYVNWTSQLDWFFTSVNWTSVYPNTLVIPLAKPIFDHIPCQVV